MTSTPGHRTPSLSQIAKIVLAFLLVGFVLSQTNPRQLLDLWATISIRWLILSVVLFLVTTLLKALQYYGLMKDTVTYPQILSIVILQNAVSNFLATSAGIASYLASMRLEHNVKISRAAAVFLWTKIGDLIALWVALILSTWLAWDHIGILRHLASVLLTGMSVAILILIATIFFKDHFIYFLQLVLDRTGLSRRVWIQKGLDVLQQLAETSEKSRPLERILLVVTLSLIYLSATIVWSYSCFMIFNLRLNVVDLIFVTVLLQLISYIPIQIFGGLGVTETTSLYFWGLLGIAASVITPVLVGIRILSYLWNLLPLIYLPLYTVFLEKRGKSAA